VQIGDANAHGRHDRFQTPRATFRIRCTGTVIDVIGSAP
jgi:hypothetical protein